MNKEIKEALHVGEEGPEVRDLAIQMNTIDGTNIFTTDKMNGRLQAIILNNDSNQPIDILIKSEFGYTLFEEKQHRGVHYFPLAIGALNPKKGRLNFTNFNFYLNERLTIAISGIKNTNINIRLRFS